MNDLQTYLLSKKYARAFLKLTAPRLSLDSIEKTEELIVALRHRREAFYLGQLSLIQPSYKKDFFTRFCASYGLGDIYDTLIDLLIIHKRLLLLPVVLQQIVVLYQEMNNIMEFMLTSAAPLSEESVGAIISFLHHKTGKEIVYKTKIDRSLIAGVKVTSDTLGWEYSVRRQLMNLNRLR